MATNIKFSFLFFSLPLSLPSHILPVFIFHFAMLVFRAGEQGRYWYAVLGGSLEVRYHAPDTESKVSSWNTNELNSDKLHAQQMC